MNPLHAEAQQKEEDEESEKLKQHMTDSNETIAHMQAEMRELKKQAAIASLGSPANKSDMLHGKSFKKKKVTKEKSKKKAFGEEGSTPVNRDGRGWSFFGRDSKDGHGATSVEAGANPMAAMAHGSESRIALSKGGKHKSVREEELTM